MEMALKITRLGNQIYCQVNTLPEGAEQSWHGHKGFL